MYGLYISDEYEASQISPKSGVGKKIQEQIKTLNDAGIDCDNMCVRLKEATIWSKLRMRLLFLGDGLSWKVTDKVRTADYLYVRRPTTITRNFIDFLKRIRRENPNCKILMEIPTYPYDREMKLAWHRRPLLWQDRHYRKKLSQYLDRIVVLSNDTMVFGVPTLKIQNGVNLSSYRIKKQNDTNVLNIGCAAQFSFWHGIDRVLNGLALYRAMPEPKIQVHLYLAGKGPYFDTLVKETERLGIQDMVTFCGILNQEELYQLIYDRCDLGVEGLRKFLCEKENAFSSLKSREYLAVGLPFIYDGKVDVFEQEKVDFCFQASADESPIDITEVISFYKTLLKSNTKEQLSARIRNYANRHVGWEQTFENVIQWLKQNSVETH